MILELLVVILVVALLASWKWYDKQISKLKAKFATDIVESRKDAVAHSRSTIEGQVFEHLVPHFPEWKYGSPSDARFIASPLDYVVFVGLHKNDVKEIVFIEVKTGKSQVTKRQRSVRKAIQEGRVRYDLLEIKDNNEGNNGQSVGLS